ncbi:MULTISPECIES: response regulator transcription factor [unclassified Pseudomonas]|uniref:response regulator transcription factor n=1 Tax=unclassified Pseudomonas TaxID=196821 RepID=UPI000BA4C322|nr:MULTISPECIES: response regulator transcription factor [unclassified Pseudomonas]MCU1722762.1 response regulator transcription factor [Pseudomonas sp. 5P_5.1_Bac1]MCU1733025.1 response regulator transcription factor [Pseudomonas sp. 20P_3.2_Bac4]MCU1744126.1 response regulator transcription factor [Pseudomonas sp. 20P_3.2_Bac5]
MYKAMIVDDHPFIRASVRMLLRQEQFEVVAEADNGIDAMRLIREHEPDIAILDIAIPRIDGLEIITRVKAAQLNIKMLVLTSQAVGYFSLRCMRLGASGFVSKNDDLSELRKAALAIMSGYTYFPEISLSSVNRFDCHATETQRIEKLTDRELLILQQLARGLSNKAIGEAMLLSNKTISTYKTRLLEKLRVSSQVDLADLARRHTLI